MRPRKFTPEPVARGALARALDRSGFLTPLDAERAAGEVARDLAMLIAELCGATWGALKDHVLFDGPIDGASVGRDRTATELYVAALDYVCAVLESRAAEAEQLQLRYCRSLCVGPAPDALRIRTTSTVGPDAETRLAATLRRLSWQASVPTGFEAQP